MVELFGKPGYINNVKDKTLAAKSIAVFPNPSVERFSLRTDIPASCKKMDVQLMDASGRLLSCCIQTNLSAQARRSFPLMSADFLLGFIC